MKDFADLTKNVIAFLLVLCVVGVFAYRAITGAEIGNLETAIINAFMLLIGYYWGSSKGSSDKTKLMTGGQK